MKASVWYVPVVLFILIYKPVLTFHYVDEILVKCDHSIEIYGAKLVCDTVYYAREFFHTF